jgi:site-specific DNA-cytosine methylase
MDGYIPSPYSNQSGMSSHTKNYSKLLLPSYEKVKHDPDTSPNGFRPWAKQFRDITVANFGQPARALFNFVDLKAGRRSERQEQTMLQTVPDIYLAEGLAPRAQNAPPRHMGSRGSPLGASTATDFDNPAVGDASVTVGSLPGQAVMGSPVSGASAQDIHYDDAAQFTPEMDELNRFLYISLNNSYVGSKGTRLPDVPEAYCLFHYAMIHLWSMDKKNIAARKIQAVEAFNKIQFTGDAMKWKYDALEAIREIYATEYNLNDFIYQGVIDQLKNKDPETLILLTKQLNILNSSEDPSAPQNWETNLAPVVDYLVTSKAVLGGNAPIQAVLPPKGPGKPPATGPPPGMTWSTEPKDPTCIDMVCGNCRQSNHHRRKNCPMGHLDTGPTCDYCHNKGHSSNDCRKKVRDEKRPSPVNSVNPASARAELLSQLASLDAKGKDSSTNYVRSGEEVRRIPDTDPVTLSELHSDMDQDKDEDDFCPDRESDCPSHGLVQEGRSNSRSDQVTQEAFQKRFEDDLRRLMALTYEQPSEEIDIPEGSATSELSTPPTEEMRNATVFTTKSDLTEDLNGNKKRIDLESISPASPQGTIIMNPSATFEPPVPSTKEALEQYAEVVPPENPDELPDALEQLTAKNKQLEADLQAYKDLYPVPPSITDLLETPEDMVKIIGQGASQKGKSWSDTPGLPTATLPVSSKTPDLGNIIKEVNTTSADQHKSTAIIEEGPLRAKSEAGNIINAPSAPIYNVGDAEPDRGTQFIVLSLCDGLGCAAIAMQKAGLPITRYCAVELSSKARSIASHASPKNDLFPGVDHSLANDINNITEKDIAAFPRNSIKYLVGGAECSDFSKLRLLPPSEAFVKDREKQARDSGGKYIPQSYPRKGLDGDKGKTFRTCIKIWGWVKKYHPDCAYLFENVVFNDMDADWREVCEALGEPVIIDSHDYSATSRRRAWWHNNPTLQNDPEQWMGDLKPIDPQTCMDPGRTVDTYEAKGKTKVRTIGASWGGDPQSPQQQSRRKVWVHDAAFPGQPQELRITEAEKLLGMEPGTTSAPGLAPLDRLKAVGGGWDVRIATRLFKTLSQGSPQPIGYTTAQVREKALGLPQRLTKDHLMAVEDYKEMSPGAVDKLSTELQAFYVALLQHSDAPCAASIDAPCAASVNMVLHGSVIDSGASKHVCKSIEIEDGTRSTRLVGFDGSTKWTEGKGYLPIQTLTQSGNAVHLDINDADQFSSAETNLLSMGKLVVQDNWIVHCSKSETYATLPDGERVDLYFNEENVLCFKHDLRTGQGALRIPGSSTAFLTRFADVRAGSHQRDSAQSQCNTISSYNAYSVLQSEDSYDDQGLMIDDGQEW